MATTVHTDGLAESLKKQIVERAVAAMKSIDALPEWVQLRALGDGEDVHGNPIKPKKPRPPKNPKNNPRLQLVDTGEMMKRSNFTISPPEVLADCVRRTFTFHAPDYYKWVCEQGRAFVLPGQLNPNVQEQVEKALHSAMG